MKACLLNSPAPIETNPLRFKDVPNPNPGKGEVLVRVHACGVCRTDLHVIEGELPPRKSPVIPGHQVVGVVEKLGEGSRRYAIGARVGVAWLHHTDGVCEYCRMGEENLCDNPTFTGYTVDGGYAEYIVAPQDFVYAIPENLDAAIVFAPAGEIVPAALGALRKGGVFVLGGIHMSPIPSFSYDLLYQERAIRSVANNTRQDGEDFLRIAAEIPVRMHTQIFPLGEANRALNALKNDAIEGAAVLCVMG